MFKNQRETPPPQWYLPDLSLSNAEYFSDFLHHSFYNVPLEFANVKTVLDLCCGQGPYTLGSLLAFPQAQIHAIDVHNILVPDAISHPRVTFHQGFVTDILETDSVPKADIVLMIHTSSHHGFDGDNISALSSHVDKFLLTCMDNALIEGKPWFRNIFQHVGGDIPWMGNYGAVWKIK